MAEADFTVMPQQRRSSSGIAFKEKLDVTGGRALKALLEQSPATTAVRDRDVDGTAEQQWSRA
ncbi:hypothetical protein LTR95_003473 [Oleoguttula sp. CCFEE 5521]